MCAYDSRSFAVVPESRWAAGRPRLPDGNGWAGALRALVCVMGMEAGSCAILLEDGTGGGTPPLRFGKRGARLAEIDLANGCDGR